MNNDDQEHRAIVRQLILRTADDKLELSQEEIFNDSEEEEEEEEEDSNHDYNSRDSSGEYVSNSI